MEYLLAFLSGGILCVIAQLLIDLTGLTPAKILVLYVTVGVGLGAVGAYQVLKEIFGCGVSLPLLGFGGTMAEGTRKAVDELGLFGALTGGLSVTAGGIAAAIVFGFLACLVFRGKPKG